MPNRVQDHVACAQSVHGSAAPNIQVCAGQVRTGIESISAPDGGCARVLLELLDHSAPLRVMRDAIFDHTPLLQKVVGEASPGEIMAQLAAIDQAEARFEALRAT
jgi:hypothetical protein